MADLELIIGNKKYSSWSMRPWIAMKVFDIPFVETLVRFDHADPENHNPHFKDVSPARKVPTLRQGGLKIWDSLAILEYLAEIYPDRRWWPGNRDARAHARSISNEMHSGFFALRDECPMNMARKVSAVKLSKDAKKDVARVEDIWRDCLSTSGGPFLFGKFTIADAMFAPVVNRFEKYEASDCKDAEKYMASIKSLDAWKDWERDGISEPWIVEIAEK